MALKKRGFNVDRILNQQREERLRLQAEAVRERGKAAEAAQLSAVSPSPQAISASARDDQSIMTDSSDTAVTSTAGDDKSGKRKSLFNRFRRDSKSGGPTMPGLGGIGMPSLPGLSGAGIGAGLGPGAGGGLGGLGVVGGAGSTTTKRVSARHFQGGYNVDWLAYRPQHDP